MSSEDNEIYDYNPIPPNFYKYEIDNILIQDIDYLLIQNSVSNIYLINYSVNNTGLYPFLQYYLLKEYNDKLTFPSFNLRQFTDIDTEKLISFSQCFLYTLFSNEKIEKDNEFKGFYYYNSNLYLFFDFTNSNLILNDIYKKSNIWSVIATEIYQLTTLDMKIDNTVIDFFMNNIPLLYLKDLNEHVYELPDIWYCGREENLLNFTYTFGVSKNINGIFGCHYYFTNYKNALLEGSWSKIKEEQKIGKTITDKNGKYLKGGIVRFALFTGNCLIKMNKINEPIDKSELKKIKLEESVDNKREKLLMRITDYDGIWSDNYDSVFIGNVELDDGTKFNEGPLIAVKNYNQQIPLSYHYIDNRNVTNKNEDYQLYSLK